MEKMLTFVPLGPILVTLSQSLELPDAIRRAGVMAVKLTVNQTLILNQPKCTWISPE
jgi:hypothetical protein